MFSNMHRFAPWLLAIWKIIMSHRSHCRYWQKIEKIGFFEANSSPAKLCAIDSNRSYHLVRAYGLYGGYIGTSQAINQALEASGKPLVLLAKAEQSGKCTQSVKLLTIQVRIVGLRGAAHSGWLLAPHTKPLRKLSWAIIQPIRSIYIFNLYFSFFQFFFYFSRGTITNNLPKT